MLPIWLELGHVVVVRDCRAFVPKALSDQLCRSANTYFNPSALGGQRFLRGVCFQRMGNNPNPGWSVGSGQMDRIAEFHRQSGRSCGACRHRTFGAQNRKIHDGIHNHLGGRVRWRVRLGSPGGPRTSLEMGPGDLIE
jgi:hypothetical protein